MAEAIGEAITIIGKLYAEFVAAWIISDLIFLVIWIISLSFMNIEDQVTSYVLNAIPSAFPPPFNFFVAIEIDPIGLVLQFIVAIIIFGLILYKTEFD